MSNHFQGSKYDANLDTAEIAKLVRADIKAAVKSGTLPAGKYSVRIERYSMGSSISVRIGDLDGVLFEPEYLVRGEEFLRGGPVLMADDRIAYPSRYLPWVNETVSMVEEMLNAYNHDRSDSMSDYYDVKFHARVTLDSDWERFRRELEKRPAAPVDSAQVEFLRAMGVL